MKYMINAKTYCTSPKKTQAILRSLEKAKGKPIVCLPPADLHLAKTTSLAVWAQHVDPITPGAHTGFILPEHVKALGVKGTLINHSEHPTKDIAAIVKRCKEVKLKTMILVPKASDVEKVRKLKPDFIGVEPPQFIGSSTISVASKPQLIKKSVQLAKRIPLFVGAGVNCKEDILISKGLGASGVLIASKVMKAKNPGKALNSLHYR